MSEMKPQDNEQPREPINPPVDEPGQGDSPFSGEHSPKPPEAASEGRTTQAAPPADPAPGYGTSGWSTEDYRPLRNKNAETTGWVYGKQGHYQQDVGAERVPPARSDRQDPNGAGHRPNEPYTWNFADYQSAQTVPKPAKARGVAAFGIFLAVIVMLALTVFAALGVYSLFADKAAPSGPAQSGQYPQLTLRDRPAESRAPSFAPGELTTSEIAAKVQPSVVGIAVYTSARSITPSGEGSGIIMDSEGYIITNAHVVEGQAAISVILHNGDAYTGSLVGTDSRTDLAVVKIEADNLAYAEFGNSTQLMVGEKSVAIGNPGGTILAGTVTQGCISAVNRPLKADGFTQYFIQTDAAINPGNSGGPLVNSYGQVVGINSSKIIATGYEGIGFAIPINDAKPIIDQIIQSGRVTRAVIGIVGYGITPAAAQRNDLPIGIYVQSVQEYADIASQDVQAGDVITHIDSSEVKTLDDVNDLLSEKRPGDTVMLTIFRPAGGEDARREDGSTFEVEIMLAEDNAV